MTPRDDRSPNMPPSVQVDAAIERVLRGDAVGDDVADFARFVDDVRVIAGRPPPPSPALAALLAGSAVRREARSTAVPPTPRSRLQARLTRPTSRRSRSARTRLRVAAIPLAGKAAVLLAVATSAAAGAAAGILLEPATDFVRRAIEVVTPFELPGEDAARDGRSAQPADHASADGIDPDATATVPTASPPASASAAGVAQDPAVEANADPQSEPNPTDETSTSAETYPSQDFPDWPVTGNAPVSSPPPSKGPKKAAPPDAGPPTEPGPKTGHVPPWHAPPGTPRPGGPGSGDAPLFDQGQSADRPGGPRPQQGPPLGAGPGTGSNEEGPTSGPPPAAGHAPSAGGGRDHGPCDQSRAGAPRPAHCAPGPPHDPGSARAMDAPEAGPPLP